ncbi:MAG: GNAT family N-acetyltransferase [Dehalococcoidia bacterium]
MTTSTRTNDGTADHIQRRYPRRDTLRSGREIVLRLMAEEDRERFLTFARNLPPDDLLYLRWDITDDRVVNNLILSMRLNRNITVLAFGDGDEIIGEAALTHSETDWTRHIGDIRIIVSPGARGEGLGRYLAEEIFVAAEILGLERLSAQMTNDQVGAQAVFRGLGFEPVALLPGFVIARDGQKHDLLVMAYDVASRSGPATPQEPGKAPS